MRITPEEFKKDILTLASQIDVEPREIHIRAMKRKWGSCSSKGRLTFNKELLNESREVRLEIILHELLHLKYPNHGKMFKSLLSTYLKIRIGIDDCRD